MFIVYVTIVVSIFLSMCLAVSRVWIFEYKELNIASELCFLPNQIFGWQELVSTLSAYESE